jgi:glycosyltransferase involved in cell wall biosynthesis
MGLNNKVPKVSIVIPTYNSAQTLPSCLESIRNQTYRNIEVIVVDALSSDETVKISERFGAQVVLQQSNQAEARNVGVAKSEGEYVLFLDSDQVLSPSVVEECVKKCLNEMAEMVRIPEVFVGKGYWSVCSAVWKNRYEAVEHVHKRRQDLMHGEPRFFVKRPLQEFGAFDAMLVWGEDYELYERLKGANIREGFCTSVLYHQEAASLKQIFLKNLHYGKSMPTFVKQTKRLLFSSMLSHALLVFAEIVKEPPRLDLVLGCFLLFSVKSGSMLIGVLRGAGR